MIGDANFVWAEIAQMLFESVEGKSWRGLERERRDRYEQMATAVLPMVRDATERAYMDGYDDGYAEAEEGNDREEAA
jgi:hypothetical protein